MPLIHLHQKVYLDLRHFNLMAFSLSLSLSLSGFLSCSEFFCHRTQVRFQQRKIKVTCTFRTVSRGCYWVAGFSPLKKHVEIMPMAVVPVQKSNIGIYWWHWDDRHKSNSARASGGFQDGTLCLQSTSCYSSNSGPVQSGYPGRPWWCYRW